MSLQALSIFVSSKLLPLILSIVGFGILVVVHEFGHFIFCKIFGIHTPTFSVGFGKPIIEKKIGGTNFRIARIPLGGYVEIAGLQEMGQGDQEHAQAKGSISFAEKPFWQKFLVLMGGIIFNLMFAYMTFCTLFLIGSTKNTNGILISNVVKDSAAHKQGLLPGDVILDVNKKTLIPKGTADTALAEKTLLNEIRSNPGKKVTFLIEREGTKIEKIIRLDSKSDGSKEIGSLGSHLATPIPKLPFLQAVTMGIKTTNMWIYKIAHSLKSVFAKKSLDGAGGPVMILALGFKTAQSGIVPFLLFFAMMSINLALFNLLPLGITDGGQLMFATVEAIIRRPVPDIFRIIVNIVSIGLFALLAIYLTYKDIYMLFGKALAGLYAKLIALFS